MDHPTCEELAAGQCGGAGVPPSPGAGECGRARRRGGQGRGGQGAAGDCRYFPTKEDLVYSGLEFFEARLLEAIRDRKPGESILAAFERFVTEPRGLLAADNPDAGERPLAVIRLITDSSALLAREQRIYAGYAAALAALIAGETQARPDDIAPWVAANAMIGLHKALVDHVRRRVLAGQRDRARIARELRAQARQAFALLEHGLGHLGAADGSAG